jgi:hypothetical protein
MGLEQSEAYRRIWAGGPSNENVSGFDDRLKAIGVSVDVDAMMRETYSHWDHIDNRSMRQTLHELQEVRNTVLHRGGIADERLSVLGEEREEPYLKGEPIQLGFDDCTRFGIAVHYYAGAALHGAANAFGLHPIWDEDKVRHWNRRTL